MSRRTQPYRAGLPRMPGDALRAMLKGGMAGGANPLGSQKKAPGRPQRPVRDGRPPRPPR